MADEHEGRGHDEEIREGGETTGPSPEKQAMQRMALMALLLILAALLIVLHDGSTYGSHSQYWGLLLYAAGCVILYRWVISRMFDIGSARAFGWVVVAMVALPMLDFGSLAAHGKRALVAQDVGTSAAVAVGTVTRVDQRHVTLLWLAAPKRWSWKITYRYPVDGLTYTQCDQVYSHPMFRAPLAVNETIKVIYARARPGIARILTRRLKHPDRIRRGVRTCQNL